MVHTLTDQLSEERDQIDKAKDLGDSEAKAWDDQEAVLKDVESTLEKEEDVVETVSGEVEEVQSAVRDVEKKAKESSDSTENKKEMGSSPEKTVLEEAEEIKDGADGFVSGPEREKFSKEDRKIQKRVQRMRKLDEDGFLEKKNGMIVDRLSTGELKIYPHQLKDLDKRYLPELKDGECVTAQSLATHLVTMRKEIEDIEGKAAKLGAILDSAAGEVVLSSGSELMEVFNQFKAGNIKDSDDVVRCVVGSAKDSKEKDVEKARKKGSAKRKIGFNFGISGAQYLYYRHQIGKTSLPKKDKKYLKSKIIKYKFIDGLVGLLPTLRIPFTKISVPLGFFADYMSQSNKFTEDALDKKGDMITEEMKKIGIDGDRIVKLLEEGNMDAAIELAEEGIEKHALSQPRAKEDLWGKEKDSGFLKKLWPFGKK